MRHRVESRCVSVYYMTYSFTALQSNSLNIYDFESEIVHLVGALCYSSEQANGGGARAQYVLTQR